MYLNVIELAESFGVSESTIDGWAAREGLPHTLDRGRMLFDRAEVAQWAASRGLTAKIGFLAHDAAAAPTGCQVSALLRVGGIWRDVAPGQAGGIFDQVVGKLPGATPAVRQMLAQRLRAPGGIVWAPVGGGFALPHPAVRISLGRESGALAILFLSGPLDVGPDGPPDGVPITRLFFFIAPSPRAHLDLLGRISRLLSKADASAALDPAKDDASMLAWVAANNATGKGPGSVEAPETKS